MALPPPFNDLSGEWKGSKRVFLQGEQGPVHASRIRMTIATAARNSFLMLAYTWKFETDPHEGVLLLGYDNEKQVATAAWGDSWHMSKRLLSCAGRIGRDGRFDVRGLYAAPPGPDWGWRIALQRVSAQALAIAMFNISPEGDEDIAVRIALDRET